MLLRNLLRTDPEWVGVTARLEGVASHPEDDLILATAISAEVEYLVTGDKQLLAHDGYRRLRIIAPREFLDIIQTP